MLRGIVQAPEAMKFGFAALIAAFMLFAGIALAGAGHGWVSGGFGCFALAPVCFFAWTHALGPTPSFRNGIVTLASGPTVCLAVAVATVSEGFQYFLGYWRATGLAGVSIGSLAYLNWVFASGLAIFRARPASPAA